MPPSIAATTTPANGAAMRGRGIGMLVGAGFGAWWASAALGMEPMLRSWPIEAAIVLVTAALLAAGFTAIWRSSRLASPDARTRQPRRRAWPWFLLVLVAEIVALNLAAWALAHYHRMDCLIPAIAIIVGLHFYPLARVFRAPYMHITASLMTLAGVGAVLAILSGRPAAVANAITAAICAVALWMTAAIGWMQNHRALAGSRARVVANGVDGVR